MAIASRGSIICSCLYLLGVLAACSAPPDHQGGSAPVTVGDTLHPQDATVTCPPGDTVYTDSEKQTCCTPSQTKELTPGGPLYCIFPASPAEGSSGASTGTGTSSSGPVQTPAPAPNPTVGTPVGGTPP
jgi:hypothetical protein